jgi:hypothetical protein
MKKLSLSLILALLLGSSLCFGQAAYIKAVDSTSIATSGKTFTHINIIGELNITAEYVISGSPSITSIVLQGCMRGNGVTPDCVTLSTYTASTSGLVQVTGLFDQYTVTPTWTGGASPSVQVNWLGTANSSPSAITNAQLFNNNYAAITTAVTVKSASGQLLGWMITNGVATACWLQVFNATSGNVTLGTTVPVISIPLPLSAGGAVIQGPAYGSIPAIFSTAMSVAATTTANGASTCATGATVQLWFQ